MALALQLSSLCLYKELAHSRCEIMKYKSQSKNTLELSPPGSVGSFPLQQYSEEKVLWLS